MGRSRGGRRSRSLHGVEGVQLYERTYSHGGRRPDGNVRAACRCDWRTKVTTDREVALVTGAGQGIGLATPKRLLEDGFHVVMVDRNPEPLAGHARSLRTISNAVEHHALSITDRDAVAALIASLPRLDVVVNNAAIFWDGKFD